MLCSQTLFWKVGKTLQKAGKNPIQPNEKLAVSLYTGQRIADLNLPEKKSILSYITKYSNSQIIFMTESNTASKILNTPTF